MVRLASVPLVIVALFMSLGCDDRAGPAITISNGALEDVDAIEARFPLKTYPAKEVFLGILHPGESTVKRIWLENSLESAVHPASYHSSCRCVSAKLPDEVPAMSREVLEIRFDGEKEPDFVGELLVILVLRDRMGGVVSKLHLLVDVVDHSSVNLAPRSLAK